MVLPKLARASTRTRSTPTSSARLGAMDSSVGSAVKRRFGRLLRARVSICIGGCRGLCWPWLERAPGTASTSQPQIGQDQADQDAAGNDARADHEPALIAVVCQFAVTEFEIGQPLR